VPACLLCFPACTRSAIKLRSAPASIRVHSCPSVVHEFCLRNDPPLAILSVFIGVHPWLKIPWFVPFVYLVCFVVQQNASDRRPTVSVHPPYSPNRKYTVPRYIRPPRATRFTFPAGPCTAAGLNFVPIAAIPCSNEIS